MSKEQILEGSDNEFNLAFGQQSADMGLETSILNPESISAQLPPLAFVARAEYTRDGHDLIMTVSDGSGEKNIVIKNYFAGVTPPSLQTTDGVVISPQMVAAFMQNNGDEYYAQGILKQLLDGTRVEHTDGMVATVENIDGNALVIRNGRAIALKEHDMLMKGDVISTADGEKLEIVFADGTNFQLGGESRVSIDEFSFDEATSTGTQVLSILHGDFSYSSGLIAKDDPSSVTLRTPMGEIGIRGTKVVGDINANNATASITILEGRAIYQNLSGRQFELDQGFDTLRISNGGDNVREIAISPERVARDYDVFGSIESVSAFMLRPDQSDITDLSAVEVNIPNFDSITIDDARALAAGQFELDHVDIPGATSFLPGISRILGDSGIPLSAFSAEGIFDTFETIESGGGHFGSQSIAGGIIDANGRASDTYIVDLRAVNGQVGIFALDNARVWAVDTGGDTLYVAYYAINLDYSGSGDLHITEKGRDVSFAGNIVTTPEGYRGSSSEGSVADDLLVVFSAGGDIYRTILLDTLILDDEGEVSGLVHSFGVHNYGIEELRLIEVENDYNVYLHGMGNLFEANGYNIAPPQAFLDAGTQGVLYA